MASISKANKLILKEISSIELNNLFIQYIIKRIQSKDYRGWHISQHNRYDIKIIKNILNQIYEVVGENDFAIPPGDFKKTDPLQGKFQDFRLIVDNINPRIGKGTINSVKKNFFPDIEKAGFLERKIVVENAQRLTQGRITSVGINLINEKTMFGSYKIYTDGLDKLLGDKISGLAETIRLSDYCDDTIDIFEFMFILSDLDEELDKIELLHSYRSLKRYQQDKVTELIQKFADPDNWKGNRTELRDFGNWKNQTQQILTLLGSTVYFVVEYNKGFRLNYGNEGFFEEPTKRSSIPKREYFDFHEVEQRKEFELHHIIPMKSARNKKEAKSIDDFKNLIYIDKKKHKEITKQGSKNVVLDINPQEIALSDIENRQSVKITNGEKVLYSELQNKVDTLAKYNTELLRLVFGFKCS